VNINLRPPDSDDLVAAQKTVEKSDLQWLAEAIDKSCDMWDCATGCPFGDKYGECMLVEAGTDRYTVKETAQSFEKAVKEYKEWYFQKNKSWP